MFSTDAQDILGGGGGGGSGSQLAKKSGLPTMKLTNVDKKKKITTNGQPKRPVGMHRELYNLFVHQGKDNNKEKIESLMPTQTKKGFSLAKAQLGKRPVRKWLWCPFENEARKDGLALKHWEREDKHSTPYSFVQFNKQLDVPSFTDEEYEEHLVDPRWTREQTQHLLELCKQFDLRWPIIEDRFDQELCRNRKSMEDMKERYYGLVNTLNDVRNVQADPLGYDAEHERRRKEQLEKQWDRTEEQIKEEEELVELVKKIEAKRKDRERKAYDLQKLINQADRISISPDGSMPSSSTAPTGPGRGHHRRSIKKIGTPSFMGHLLSMDSHIRWPEFKTPGPHLRSQEMKLPSNIGQKKLSNIGLVVTTRKIVSIGLEYPHAYEEIVKQYNDFRSHIVLLQDLKTALHNTELELDQLAAQMPADKLSECPIIEPRFRVSSTFYEELERSPVRVLNTPMTEGGKGKGKGKQQQKPAPVTARAITKLIEVNTAPTTVTRKRRMHYPEGTPPTRSQTAIQLQQQQLQQH
ncbi:hypothetical protein niasHT_025876 [Heterodera trifolii]|uniref:DNA methyltransferase 1-associated protein 1 n=1 Tax=Heterodera trifolii TaxID=157864 RepID=A0ABD2KJM1_9BILA